MQRIRLPLTRRSFLGALGTLPALGTWAVAEESPPPSVQFRREPPPLTAADQVLDVMGFEPLARAALPPAHYGYLATGVDDGLTVVKNHEAFAHYEIRARRFADLSHLDLSRTVFGARWPSPLYLSAVSGLRAFNPDGELAVARAARTRSTQLMLSTGSSAPIGEVYAAAGATPWQQLYPTNDWGVTMQLRGRGDEP